jgi:hypothetical protein
MNSAVVVFRFEAQTPTANINTTYIATPIKITV